MDNSKYRDFTKKENKWIKRFESVMKSAPDTLFMFVGEGICIYTTDESNKRYITKDGGVDSQAPAVSIQTSINYDGGAY